MPNMSPEEVWGQVVKALRLEIGEGAFTSYLEQARVREGQAGALFLVTPTAYARDWGMNAVRLLTTWAAVEPEQGVYDEAYLDALAERLDWAKDAGLHVVLDMHQDVYGEGFGFDGAALAPGTEHLPVRLVIRGSTIPHL